MLEVNRDKVRIPCAGGIDKTPKIKPICNEALCHYHDNEEDEQNCAQDRGSTAHDSLRMWYASIFHNAPGNEEREIGLDGLL